ncbi:unannotated protein [freshwater metagenome]|uniref:Unannotated protein n=1 Tax=freshwater metagenome TaxID=449393 RepID=A0A6J7D351_9ZZZZ
MFNTPRRLLAAVLGLGLLAAGCGLVPAELKGHGDYSSPIQPRAKAEIRIDTKSVCKLPHSNCSGMDFNMYQLGGSLQDRGTNTAWPRGVKLSFDGFLQPGMPSLAIGGSVPTSCGPNAPTQNPQSTPTCWVGILTYRSMDTAYYPNNPIAQSDCAFLNGAPLASLNGAASLKSALGRAAKDPMSGIALVLLADSNQNGRPDGNGDMLFFTTLCGPYTGMTPTAGVLDGQTPYSYATCTISGGVMPSVTNIGEITGGNFGAGNDCVVPLRHSDFTIKELPVPPTTTTTTTTPPSTTVS